MSESKDFSDSSDDDVYFGKYTLKEAKRDVKKYVPKSIKRRHSVVCKLPDAIMNDQEELPMLMNHFDDKLNISSNSNSKCPSEYLTPNESAVTDRLSQNSEFFAKLNQVINEPLSGASSYTTACDQTNCGLENQNILCEDTFIKRMKNQTTLSLDKIHQTLVENTLISDEDFEEVNDEGQSQPDVIKNSIISISDDNLSQSQLQTSTFEFITKDEINGSKSPVMSTGEFKCEDLISDAINDEYVGTNSDKSRMMDENNSFSGDRSFQTHTEEQQCYSVQQASASESIRNNLSNTEQEEYSGNTDSQESFEDLSGKQDSSGDTSFDETAQQFQPLHKYDRVINNFNQMSKISEKTEFTTCYEERKSFSSFTKISTGSSSDSYSHTEKVMDSEEERSYEKDSRSKSQKISKAFELSGLSELSKDSEENEDLRVSISLKPESPSSSVDQLDDTLEKINKILAQEVNYVMPKRTSREITPVKQFYGSSDDVIISGSFMSNSNSSALKNRTGNKEKFKCHSAEQIKKPSVVCKETRTTVKSRIPLESKIKPPSSTARNLFTKQKEKPHMEAFKVPTKPAKKLTTPVKIMNPALKNVVSPVGIYIKHTPKYSPLIKLPQKDATETKISQLARKHPAHVKENIPCASSMEIPKVIYKPAKTKVTTVENQVVLPQNIKKLLREKVATKHERRIQDDSNQSIERRLMESDLTIDVSATNQDISVLTNRQVFDLK